MAYSLRPRRAVADEIKRVADKQFALALAHLRRVGTAPADEAVHVARRHLKKVRALLRLVRPVVPGEHGATERRLRAAIRRLAPVADGRSVIQTLERLKPEVHDPAASAAIDAGREALLLRAQRVDRTAEVGRTVPKVHRLVSLERTRIDAWTLPAYGYASIAPGLGRTARRARRAMARAIATPTSRHYLAWRRWTKMLGLQVRLIERRCGHALDADRRHLEALDACLGEYHNVTLLHRILKEECVVWRADTTRLVKALRRYQIVLRRRAEILGPRALGEPARAFLARARRGWHSTARQLSARKPGTARASATAPPRRRPGRAARRRLPRGGARSAARNSAGR